MEREKEARREGGREGETTRKKVNNNEHIITVRMVSSIVCGQPRGIGEKERGKEGERDATRKL